MHRKIVFKFMVKNDKHADLGGSHGQYEIERDVSDALVICRVEGELDDSMTSRMAQDCRAELIRRATISARSAFCSTIAAAPWHRRVPPRSWRTPMGDLWREGDRTAVVTADSLSKVRAKQTMRDGGMVFISEKAARMWLAA